MPLEHSITIRTCLLYEFKLNSKPTEALQRIRKAFGEDSLTNKTVHRWFKRFSSGNESLEDAPRSGRRSSIIDKIEQVCAVVENNPSITCRELSRMFKLNPATLARNLASLRKSQKLREWIPPYEYKTRNKQQQKQMTEKHRLSGRPSVINNEQLREAVKQNPSVTCRQLSQILNVNQKTLRNHLQMLRKSRKLQRWIPPSKAKQVQTKKNEPSDYGKLIKIIDINESSDYVDEITQFGYQSDQQEATQTEDPSQPNHSPRGNSIYQSLKMALNQKLLMNSNIS